MYQILDATLFITQVELKPPLLLADANVLGMKRKEYYPFTILRLKPLLRVLGPIDNEFLGQIPERIQIALFKNTAFVGSAGTIPF